jgi:hypothetical protein
LITNPLIAPIWIYGVAYAFFDSRLRWIGWTYVLLIAMMIALHGRNYYSGDVYSIVIAAGAVAVERARFLRSLRPAIVATVAVAGMLAVPFILPVLAEARLADIVAGGQRLVSLNVAPARNADAAITSNFADMHGWPELARTVAGVYAALPPEQRAHAAILASNFGEAAAIDFYGGAYALPPALSGHNNYWVWGPRGYDGSVVIEVNGTCEEPGLFRLRRPRVATFHSPWVMPAEDGIPISICAQPNQPLAAYWPRLRTYI